MGSVFYYRTIILFLPYIIFSTKTFHDGINQCLTTSVSFDYLRLCLLLLSPGSASRHLPYIPETKAATNDTCFPQEKNETKYHK